MVKKNKAHAVEQLVKQGYSNKEILGRIAVSGGYISQIRKKLAEEKAARAEEKLAEVKAQAEAEAKANEVDTLLDTRADQYGSFMQSADAAIRLKGIMHNAIARNDAHLFPDQILALDMIAVKLSRIVNGNASHRDSWLDIAGYAKLVADRLGGISR